MNHGSGLRSLLLIAGCFLVLPLRAAAAADASLIIEHGPRHVQQVALTFDACPTSLPDEYDEDVVKVLLRENAAATLFLSGRWVERNPDKARFLAAQPQFEIAAHTYLHPHLTAQDDARILREMKRTQAIIKKVTNKVPRYYRPPFGEVDERVAALAKTAGARDDPI